MQLDVEVGVNYMEYYMLLFKLVEVCMMLVVFLNMEIVYIVVYVLLFEIIGMLDFEFFVFMEYEEMVVKYDYFGQFGIDMEEDILILMVVFGGFIEGL